MGVIRQLLGTWSNLACVWVGLLILQDAFVHLQRPTWYLAIFWTLDVNHIVCDPNSLLQGHAIWHILTAASAGLLYLYYRSEV